MNTNPWQRRPAFHYGLAVTLFMVGLTSGLAIAALIVGELIGK